MKEIESYLNEDGNLFLYETPSSPGNPGFTIDKESFMSLAIFLLKAIEDSELCDNDSFEFSGAFGEVTDE